MYAYIKRGLDVIISLLAMILLSPVILGVAMAVKITSPGPVLFKQKRIGQGGRYFMIYKFRTMRSDSPKDTATHLLKDPARYITPVGAFLRRSSLDELPQLANVLKGDMALVGPRPMLYNQFDLIKAREAGGINLVRPGITGWAQINGRDEIPTSVKVQFDQEYVDNLGFGMDLRCFFGSILPVLRSDGYREGSKARNKRAAAKDKDMSADSTQESHNA